MQHSMSVHKPHIIRTYAHAHTDTHMLPAHRHTPYTDPLLLVLTFPWVHKMVVKSETK